MSVSNLSADVHESLKGKLADLDDQRTILHTVCFTNQQGENESMDIMAEDPMDAIDKVRGLKNRD